MVGNLQEDYDDYGKNQNKLIILHVFVDQNVVHIDLAKESVDSFNITYPVIAGDEGFNIKESYGVYQQGANDPFILIAPNREILAGWNIYTTFIEQNSFRKKLKDLGILKQQVSINSNHKIKTDLTYFTNNSSPTINFFNPGEYSLILSNLSGKKISESVIISDTYNYQYSLFTDNTLPSGFYLINIFQQGKQVTSFKFNYRK